MKKSKFDKETTLSNEEYIQEYLGDFERATKLLEDIGACVAVFGSARFTKDNFYYKKGVEISKKLAQNGFHIVTGGSGGIMEAANKGAYEIKDVHSIGFNLYLPFEQLPNGYTTKDETLNSFSVRKYMLLKNTTSCVVLPGGFGTLDELFDIITLVISKKFLPISIHLIGKEFWQPLMTFIEKTLVDYEVISKDEANILHVSDDIDEVVQKIKENVKTYLDAMSEVGLEDTKRYKFILEQFKKMR